MKQSDLKQEYERDERLSRLNQFIYSFGGTFIIIFTNSYGLIFLYNKLIREQIGIGYISLFIVFYLVFGCAVSSIVIYFTRSRVYSRHLMMISRAARRVANGDFSVRLPVKKTKTSVTEIDILKEDFNTMVCELASIEGLRDSFIADVSHEIKTPLSVIRGYIDLLSNPDLTREEQEEYIGNICLAVDSLKNLTNNILKLNKLENQAILQTKEFSLDEQLRRSILSFEKVIEEKQLSVSVDLDDAIVSGDEALIELVWNNLIQNSLKFTEKGGCLSLTLHNKGNEAVVTVSDSGCGMSPETQSRIFEKFYQGEPSRANAGNGLGLSLVKKVVDLHNGKISVKSEIGKGTEIQVVFSLKQI